MPSELHYEETVGVVSRCNVMFKYNLHIILVNHAKATSRSPVPNLNTDRDLSTFF